MKKKRVCMEDYNWKKDMKYIFKLIAIMVLIAIFIAGTAFFVALKKAVENDIYRIEHTINLNGNKAPLAVGDTWKVDNQFAVHLESVTEISEKQASEEHSYTDTAGKRYFVVNFSYENINFAGYYVGQEFKEKQLRMSVHEYGYDTQGNRQTGVVSNGNEGWYNITKIDEKWVPITQGIKSSDNIFTIEVNKETCDVNIIELVFKIPTVKALEIYEQVFQFPI